MELIAASRIVKARERVRASRPYAEKMIEVIRNVGRASGDVGHPLLERREIRTMGVLVVTSDRGLAGAYNSSVLRMAERHMAGLRAEGAALSLYAGGQEGTDLLLLPRLRHSPQLPGGDRPARVSPTPKAIAARR